MTDTIKEIDARAMDACAESFRSIDNISHYCTEKVLNAFSKQKISEAHLHGSTGYGYTDIGRDALDKVYADAFECEDALVRPQIISGTHALTIALFGMLRPGDCLMSVTGSPYDTLYDVVGINKGTGSLKEYGIDYIEVPFENSEFDIDKIKFHLQNKSVKLVFIQKSKGYLNRRTLSSEQIGEITRIIKTARPDVYVMTDNCYGEFCEKHEPVYYGVDLMVGSLIKNAGGGLAKTGGYLAGTHECIERCSYRLTCPGIGRESAATGDYLKDFYQGFFMAPHTVAQALKTAVYCANVFKSIGYAVNPLPDEDRYDIIQTVSLNCDKALIAFCQGIQAGAPIDSFALPVPADMAGYADKVIMAAGTFVQGASIELSADGPLRAPFTVFMQGALTFESGRLGILKALENILNINGNLS